MHTLMKHWVGGLVGDGCGGFDGEAGPFLHGGPVDVLFGVLLCVSGFFGNFFFRDIKRKSRGGGSTSKVIQEMGSSSGIGVRLMSSTVSFWSSKANVKIAPGGVQVPTMRWWTGIAGVWSCGVAVDVRREV